LKFKACLFKMRAFMKRRVVPLLLALAGACAFALALQSPWWGAGEVAIGPFGSRHCFGGECREAGLSWIGASELWLRASVATRAAGYIAMFLLVIVAGTLAARRTPRLIAGSTMVAVLTATVTGAYFFVAFPGLGGVGLAYGAIIFGVAIVLALASVVLTLRMPEPS
jgi:hypothetical protein